MLEPATLTQPTQTTYAPRVRDARERMHMTQRALADATGLSQATVSRIEGGIRDPKMNEVLAIAWATGASVSEITGRSDVRDRVRCVARATGGTSMEAMRRELIHYLEVDAYLEEMGIPEPA